MSNKMKYIPTPTGDTFQYGEKLYHDVKDLHGIQPLCQFPNGTVKRLKMVVQQEESSKPELCVELDLQGIPVVMAASYLLANNYLVVLE